jgi:hypothetical protein
MSSLPPFRRLFFSLVNKDYGNTAAEVLETCALVAQYAEERTPDQVMAFQESVHINPQVWLRLIALHRDERLKQHLEHLPPSYTTLYAIHRMGDEELDAAVQQGVIHPKASSHSILFWTKQNRQQLGQEIPPWRCLVLFDQELDRDEFVEFQVRVNQVAHEYGARLVSESDFSHMKVSKADSSYKMIAELEQKILELSEPLYNRFTERDRHQLGAAFLENLCDVDIVTFAMITRPDSDIHSKSKRHHYSSPYIYKIALEFLKADSRSKRFNYKRRLKQLAEKQPDLKKEIQEVLETYMKR